MDIKSPSSIRWQLKSAIFSVKYNAAKGEVFPLNLNDSCNYRERCSQLYMENKIAVLFAQGHTPVSDYV